MSARSNTSPEITTRHGEMEVHQERLAGKAKKLSKARKHSKAESANVFTKGKRPAKAIYDPGVIPLEVPQHRCLHQQLWSNFVAESNSLLRHEGGCKDLHTLIWFERLHAGAEQDPAVEASALALSCAALGRSKQDNETIRRSSQAYGRALSLISKAVSGPGADSGESILIACFNLLAAQLFANQPKDFAAHVAGIGAVMQNRGPTAFASGGMHRFLLAIRLHLILGALTTHQGTFLADKEWLRAASAEDDGDFGRLIDIMAHLPAARSTFLKARQTVSCDAQLAAATTVLSTLWNVRAALYSWSLNIGSELQKATEVARPIPAEGSGRRSSYAFVCFRDAVVIALYWACLTEVYNILSQTYEIIGMFQAYAMAPKSLDALADASFQTVSIQQAVRPFAAASKCRSSAMLYATSICSAAKHFTFNSGDAFRWVYLIFPLKVASRCFLLNLPEASSRLESIQETLRLLQMSGAHILQSLAEDNDAY